MSSLKFLWQYITKPKTVGAVWPSSRYLADKMVKNINFDTAVCIVEYGPGTGVFTDKLLQLRNENTHLLLFETNEAFCLQLQEKYAQVKNIRIINDSAANIGQYLAGKQADYVISGLPFASLPQEVSSNILAQTKQFLHAGGYFITFQYTLLKKDFIRGYFPVIEIKREIRNIPPAYVFYCRI